MSSEASRARELSSILWVIHDKDASERKKVLDIVGFDSHLVRGNGYENVKTLSEAVQVAQGQLQQDNRQEYASLLSEDRIRSAIRTAITSYDAKIHVFEKRYPGARTREKWAECKPVLLKIASYGLSDNTTTYEGLLLRLIIAKPNSQECGLPIIDVYFGYGGN